jgi:biopolymer transport protein ExbD
MAITRKKRGIPPLNGAALADISFLFLIFFLLVATMDFDQGIPRQLPRIVEEDFTMEIQNRNLMVIQINSQDQVAVRNLLHPGVFYERTEELLGTSTEPSLVELVREFILNERNLPILPIVEAADFGPGIGTQNTTGGWHVISLQNDLTTSY